MITAKFVFGKDGLINGFLISGHSGSEECGRDIICSAVSSPAYMVCNTLTEIMNLSPEIHESDGRLSLSLAEDEEKKAQDMLNGFYLHLQELEKMYPEYIKVERGAKYA